LFCHAFQSRKTISIKQIRSFFTLSIEIYLLEPLYLVKAIAIQVYLSNACRHRESESIAQL